MIGGRSRVIVAWSTHDGAEGVSRSKGQITRERSENTTRLGEEAGL